MYHDADEPFAPYWTDPEAKVYYGLFGNTTFGTKKIPESHTPLVKLDRLGGRLNLTCKVMAKCGYMNETGDSSYALVNQVLGNEKGLNNKSLVASDTSGFGLALAFAASKNRLPSPILVRTSSDKQHHTKALKKIGRPLALPNKMRLPINDSNILECLGTRSFQSAISHDRWSLPDDLQQQSLDELVTKLNDIPNFESRLLNDEESIPMLREECISFLRQIMIQTEGDVGLIVCTPALGRLITETSEVDGMIKVAIVSERKVFPKLPPQLKSKPDLQQDSDTKGAWRSYEVSNREAAEMAYFLLHDEGILCSDEDGRIMAGAYQAIQDFKKEEFENTSVVVCLEKSALHSSPSHFQCSYPVKAGIWSDFYMEGTYFWWWETALVNMHLKPIAIVTTDTTLAKVYHLMSFYKIDRVGVVDHNVEMHKLSGVLTKSLLYYYLDNDILSKYSPVRKAMSTALAYADLNLARLKDAAELLMNAEYLVLTREFTRFIFPPQQIEGERVVGIVTPEDVIKYKKNVLLAHLQQGVTIKG